MSYALLGFGATPPPPPPPTCAPNWKWNGTSCIPSGVNVGPLGQTHCEKVGSDIQFDVPGPPPAGYNAIPGPEGTTCYEKPAGSMTAWLFGPSTYNLCAGAYTPTNPAKVIKGSPPAGFIHNFSTINGVQKECWSPPPKASAASTNQGLLLLANMQPVTAQVGPQQALFWSPTATPVDPNPMPPQQAPPTGTQGQQGSDTMLYVGLGVAAVVLVAVVAVVVKSKGA